MKPKKIKLNARLKEIGVCADKLKLPIFLVGGAVRDMLLGVKSLDWDIVVEGKPSKLVKTLAKKWRSKLISHPEFGTFAVELPGSRHIDFVTARKEIYPDAGDLPCVTFSSLKDDLFRRDFTINALALCLNKSRMGEIVDYYGGYSDLKKNTLSILHNLSFRDDPTRILRLVRFAGRGFKISKSTEKLVLSHKKYLKKVSAERIAEEVISILNDKNPYYSLKLLEKWGVLKMILPGIKIGYAIKDIYKVKGIAQKLNLIFGGISETKRQELTLRLRLSRKIKKEIELLNKSAEFNSVLSGRDLIKMGYTPGPLFKEILSCLASRRFISRQKAARFVIDNYPQKR